jgi:hypothetical protein
LKRQHIASGQRNDYIRIASTGQLAEAAENGNEILDCAVVRHNDDQGAVYTSTKKNRDESFGRGVKTGDTYPARGLLKVRGYTHESGKHFYVREEFANEGKKHLANFNRGRAA